MRHRTIFFVCEAWNSSASRGVRCCSNVHNAAKRYQKDIDARRTKKNDWDHYGHKTYMHVDRKTRLIIEERSTAAHKHDSQVFDKWLGNPRNEGRRCGPIARTEAPSRNSA